MMKYNGTGVCGGIAIGKIHVIIKKRQYIEEHKVDDVDKELKRFEASKTEAKKQLADLCERAKNEVGKESAAIFEIHQMMLDDEDYLCSIKNIIMERGVNAECAVEAVSDKFSEMFSSMEDEYMKERVADVRDISERIIKILLNEDIQNNDSDESVIILADDLAPSETVQLDKKRVLSFVTVHGSANSHTAILARTMNIPALVGVGIELSPELENKPAIVDGFNGNIYIDPDEQTIKEMQMRYDNEAEKQRQLQELKGKDNVTIDGKSVLVYANISSLSDIEYVLKNDAEGVGLFRSEFIYLERGTYPTEEEQFRIYKKAVETMAGKRVIIRTLDVGADKQAEYFNIDNEENPAMGLRAIRICLTRPEIFKTQLRAIYRASKYGKPAVMYPMITSLEEVKKIKEISKEVREELKREKIPYNDIEEGVMIETPAAAIISDLIAREVDFFSIGTNDLSQYTMAVDRQNPKLDEFFDPHHIAVMRMIEMVCKNAHRENVWVGICGELGADLELTESFLRMGVDELSVSPAYVLPLREKIRSLNLSI